MHDIIDLIPPDDWKSWAVVALVLLVVTLIILRDMESPKSMGAYRWGDAPRRPSPPLIDLIAQNAPGFLIFCIIVLTALKIIR